MTAPDLTVVDLVTGFAEMIAAAGIGAWNPEGVYDADQIGITFSDVAPDPSQLIVLTPYNPADYGIRLANSTVGLQIRQRGDEDVRTVVARDATCFNMLQGLNQTVVGGVPVVLVNRVTSMQMGQDQNMRWEWQSSYYVQVTWPTLYRTD